MATVASASTLDHSLYTNNKMDKYIEQEPLPKQPSSDATKDLPPNVKPFSDIMSAVGFMGIGGNIFDHFRRTYPVTTYTESGSKDSLLSNLFKCDSYHHGCYFSVSTESAFHDHLTEEHANQWLYCFYCTSIDDKNHQSCQAGVENQFAQAEQLIEHIKSKHANLNFQCNLCFYRAFSPGHVLIHQAVEHLRNFEETLKRSLVDKKDEGSLNPIERQFLLQISEGKSDDETEVEDNKDEDCVSSNQISLKPIVNNRLLCKIIASEGASQRDWAALASYYFNEYAKKFETFESSNTDASTSYHCVYCPINSFKATQNGESDEFWIHCMTSHPAFPILAYEFDYKPVRLPKFFSSKSYSENKSLMNNLSDEEAQTIVFNFRKRLADLSLRQSYDESLMQKAFNYYDEQNSHENVESTTTSEDATSKGTKRKLESTNDLVEDEPVHTVSDEKVACKRRRIFGHLVSESIIKRTKRIGSVVATAAMAFGFYHLSHFLPQSVQNYLD